MSALTEFDSETPASLPADNSAFNLPEVPSYLIAADNHQLGNTGSSIFDPTSWGDRLDNGYKFSVSTLTRAVASTYNSVVTIGSLVGLADSADKADTANWLQGMDDDLAKYYKQNQESINTWGDVAASIVPGLGGVKVLNWAQRGVAAATEGKAGLNLASHFGTLPTKQAKFAQLAQAEMTSTTNQYTLINANLAKSLAAGYGQSALEVAAFDVAASTAMHDSPLFKDHDMGDVAYNALLGGGFIGAGILGTTVAVRTLADIKRAANVVDAATHGVRTVLTEPVAGTSPAERLAIHMNNVESIPAFTAGEQFAGQKAKAVADTTFTERNNGRLAAHDLAGKNDPELGNGFYDVISQTTSADAADKLLGAVKISRAGIESEEERLLTKSDTGDIAYLGLHGADAGSVITGSPVLSLADKLRSESEVLSEASSYKHKQGQDWSIASANGDTDAIEARYITAQEREFKPDLPIGTRDIPFLERAFQEMTADNSIDTIALKDGSLLSRTDLWNHLKELKGKEALQLQAAADITGATVTPEAIARQVNISPSYLKGERNVNSPAEDYLALQTAQQNYTASQIAAGNWRADKGLIKTYLKPQYAKVVYDTSKIDQLSAHEVDGMVAIKQQQSLYKQDALNLTNNYFGEDASKLPEQIPVSLMSGANRSGTGGGMLTSQDSGYKLLGSYMQQIGSTVNKLKLKAADDLAASFAPYGAKLLNDADGAGTEFWKLTQQLRQTPEKYVPVFNSVDNAQVITGLKNAKLVKYEAAVEAAANEARAAGTDVEEAVAKVAKPIYEDKNAPETIPLTTQGMQGFATEWFNHNAAHMTEQMNLRTAQGYTVQQDLANHFYVPPVDSRRFPYFAFVTDQSATSTGHISMIHAASAQELEQLAARVPTDQGLRVLFKSDSEEWHRAMADYDYKLGINENYIDTALKRTGVSAAHFPVTDPKVLWGELMTWRKNQDAGLIREMVEHRYSGEFAELRRQGAQYTKAQTSQKGYVAKFGGEAKTDPYTSYINTALDIKAADTTPWSAVNRLAETSISSAVSKLQDAWNGTASVEEMQKVNTVLAQIGCDTFTDAATMALANHTAPKPVLSKFIQDVGGILSFTMLRADPLNAVNNGLGHSVLYGAEMRTLLRDTFAATPEAAADMKSAVQVKLPGVDQYITSPTKLAAKAYADWFKVVNSGDKEGQELYKRYRDLGVLPSYTDQFRTMMDTAALKGTETGADLHSIRAKVFEAAKALTPAAEKYTGNKFAEEMNRFVSARTADIVASTAAKHGVISPELIPSIINTFVNRVEGNVVASQRPLMFRGPLGQAVGLFQTYQFNMLQNVFRHVANRDTKSLATLLGLQGGIYGMNGMPAFNAMNQYLVGDAAGNTSHSDLFSKTYDTVGKEAGDWLLYGAASNMLVHPDLKVNLYSRGDINPRQVTVIPTTLADVPMVGATAKLFGSMYETFQKVDKGASLWPSFLQGVEHSGISRPLAGFAQVLESTANPVGKVVSTDNAGNIVMEHDLFSAMSAARILGAKPLDEAVVTDAMHRKTVYDLSRTHQLENLGEGVKATIMGGGVPTAEQFNQFTAEYMKAGGDQQHFSGWFNRQVLAANQSKVNQIVSNATNPSAVYMQRIMGGYELQDFVNNPSKPNQ